MGGWKTAHRWWWYPVCLSARGLVAGTRPLRLFEGSSRRRKPSPPVKRDPPRKEMLVVLGWEPMKNLATVLTAPARQRVAGACLCAGELRAHQGGGNEGGGAGAPWEAQRQYKEHEDCSTKTQHSRFGMVSSFPQSTRMMSSVNR